MAGIPITLSRPIRVACCGNVFAGDDAFGPCVAERLRSELPADVELLELGIKPAALLTNLWGCQGVILVDAALPIPGVPLDQLLDQEFGGGELPPLVHDVALSSHGLSIADELAFAESLGLLPPRLQLIAAQATSTGIGRGISPHLPPLIDLAVRRTLQLVRQWREAERPEPIRR